MKLQPKTVANTIEGWNIMFPYPKKKAELAFLSAKFFKALVNFYSDEAFRLAADLIELELDQWPTIAHMRSVKQTVSSRMERQQIDSRLALSAPEEMSVVNRADDAKRLGIIMRQASGAISVEQAQRELSEIREGGG